MDFKKILTLGAALLALAVGGPAVASASDNGDAPDATLAPSIQDAQTGVDEADGQNNDLQEQVEEANTDEGQVGDGDDGELADDSSND
jgi:hypothetical protein